jgi:hypothetical protein
MNDDFLPLADEFYRLREKISRKMTRQNEQHTIYYNSDLISTAMAQSNMPSGLRAMLLRVSHANSFAPSDPGVCIL